MFSFWVEIFSMFGTLLSSFYIFMKAAKYHTSFNQKLIAVLWCAVWAAIFAAEFVWAPMPITFMRIMICFASIIFIYLFSNLRLDTVTSAFLFSYGFSYVLYYIASIVVALAFMPFASRDYVSGTNIDFNQPVYLVISIITFILHVTLAILFFRIRRVKDGFPFLLKRYAVIWALISTGFLLILITWMRIIGTSEEAYAAYYYFAGVIAVGIGIYIWIRRSISMFIRIRGIAQNDELLRRENDELRRELQRYKDNHETVRAANHNMMHRQAAIENHVIKLFERIRDDHPEYNEELLAAISDIRIMSDEYIAEIDRVKVNIKLPSTNIQMIDNLFKFFAERFASNGIEFNLKVNGSIVHMTDTVIAQNNLEMIIGNHLQDALIAVNASERSIRSVLAMIGEVGDCYEFSVHDSGIPFGIDTLVRLGTERVTTHADGSGIGFMKTFEIMRECAAGLIISEKKPGSCFSKTVTIRFDGKNQYIIKTYRPDDFPQNDRYIIVCE